MTGRTMARYSTPDEIQRFGRYFKIFTSPIISDNGETWGALELIMDITDMKMAEYKLVESERNLRETIATKDKFMSVIAHDLKAPFHSLLMLMDVLDKKFNELSEDKIKEYLKHGKASARNSYQLLQNLLDWSISQSGKLKVTRKTIHLKDIFDILKEELESSFRQKEVELKFEAEDDLFETDEYMLLTILRNLLSNARKFTDRGGSVEVSARVEEKELVLEVKDTGTGMSEEIQQKLFSVEKNKSFRGTENEEGTGLGMLLIKEFIEKLKGKIHVESSEGKGSKFTVRIPETFYGDIV
jgi:signal transduction histidine kinase